MIHMNFALSLTVKVEPFCLQSYSSDGASPLLYQLKSSPEESAALSFPEATGPARYWVLLAQWQ